MKDSAGKNRIRQCRRMVQSVPGRCWPKTSLRFVLANTRYFQMHKVLTNFNRDRSRRRITRRLVREFPATPIAVAQSWSASQRERPRLSSTVSKSNKLTKQVSSSFLQELVLETGNGLRIAAWLRLP